ncbi:hypothetical protein SSP24_33670 [Streptomyces spinoverrucosus]|uniref:Uncharacterized protein n=1 Tax=Streptomyces spinoverrucosus TaxID=284043 RepID=A0A4Y3VF31_9ACTN|nr:hypothetical protein SSP24_33670 [Streptomyces spinoverrucosus]GHB83124.1 hypothetical protein GCM10010397_63030 [Streptomyces spinoverrucosus]
MSEGPLEVLLPAGFRVSVDDVGEFGGGRPELAEGVAAELGEEGAEEHGGDRPPEQLEPRE